MFRSSASKNFYLPKFANNYMETYCHNTWNYLRINIDGIACCVKSNDKRSPLLGKITANYDAPPQRGGPVPDS